MYSIDVPSPYAPGQGCICHGDPFSRPCFRWVQPKTVSRWFVHVSSSGLRTCLLVQVVLACRGVEARFSSCVHFSVSRPSPLPPPLCHAQSKRTHGMFQDPLLGQDSVSQVAIFQWWRFAPRSEYKFRTARRNERSLLLGRNTSSELHEGMNVPCSSVGIQDQNCTKE